MSKQYKKKTIKKRRLRGGKFVASGSAGCIFRPALKCAGSNTRRNGYVSKMASGNTINDEWFTSNTPRRINTESQYFVYPTERCRLGALNASNEQDKCDVDNIGTEILQLPDGGTDLSKMVVPYEEISAFFEGFVNIFDGIALLHSRGYAHRDIKLANMVGIRNDNGTYKLRLIDFGLSDTFDNLIYYPRESNYEYWSYEMRLLSTSYGYSSKDINDFMNTLNFRKFPRWLYENPDGTSKLTRDFVQSLNSKIHSSRNNKLHIIKASEVYALGRCLFEIWYTSTSYIVSKLPVTTLATASSASASSLKLDGLLTGGTIIKSRSTDKDIPPEISELVLSLAAEMCHVDPFKRLSLDDAKVRLTRLIPFLYTVLI